MKLYHTTGFIEESNQTGKVIDFAKEGLFEFIPVPSLADRIKTLKAYINTTQHYTQLLIGFDFAQNPPTTATVLLPDKLHLFLVAKNMDKLKFSGLNFGKRILFISSRANPVDFIFNKKNIQCKTCGTGNTIAGEDLTDHIPSNITLDEIGNLLQKPLGDENHLLDLKITVGAETIIVTKDEDLKKLHSVLQVELYKTKQLTFRKNSDDSLIKDFPKILITPDGVPANVIGIVEIPVSTLIINNPDPLAYENLNNFIVHFPSFKSSVALTVNTSQFDGGSKLFYNENEVLTPAVTNHPQINNYKQVTATIIDSVAYLNEPSQVVIQHGNKKNSTPVNPLNNYNPLTNTSHITITK